jgi:penicillin-binding protein 2
MRQGGIILPDKPFNPDLGVEEFPALGLDPAHVTAVLSGMNAVTNEPGGTAYGARITEVGMEMGGKSGTAQFRQITAAERDKGLKKGEQLPWKEREHALFIAFAPVGNPRYACAVFVEHGIGGSKYAAPIARDVLRECQKRDPARRYPAEGVAVAEAPTAPIPGQPVPAMPGAETESADD